LPPWPSTALQYSKCPILVGRGPRCSCVPPQTTRVSSLDVEYIGWKSQGVSVHCNAVGLKLTALKPFEALAIIDPDCPLVRSLRTI